MIAVFACKESLFPYLQVHIERIGGATGLNDGLLSGFSVNNDSMIGSWDIP